LLQAPGAIIIIETKRLHTPNAWFQLRKLYQPVLRALFPVEEIRVCEICNLYDPQGAFPEPITLIDSFDRLTALGEDAFYVLPWKPLRLLENPND